MDILKLSQYLIENIPNFNNPEIIDTEGECYHYTAHWDKIKASNKFNGAKINKDLDRTQMISYLGEAKEEEGIVFGYEKIDDAREEGFGLDIIKICYKKAIKTLHKGEKKLDDFMVNEALRNGIEMEKQNTPETILILVTDIISFEYVEKAK